MQNPFEQTQYSNFIQIPGNLNLRGMGSSGIAELFTFLKNQVSLRQEAVKAAYIDGIISDTSQFIFVDLSGVSADTPSSIYNSKLILIDAVQQFFVSHSSQMYERLCLYPCDNGQYLALDSILVRNGLFDKVDPNGSLRDNYYYLMIELYDTDLLEIEVRDFLTPRPFDSSFLTVIEYLRYVGYWSNCLIKILNKLIYIHRKLIYGY